MAVNGGSIVLDSRKIERCITKCNDDGTWCDIIQSGSFKSRTLELVAFFGRIKAVAFINQPFVVAVINQHNPDEGGIRKELAFAVNANALAAGVARKRSNRIGTIYVSVDVVSGNLCARMKASQCY